AGEAIERGLKAAAARKRSLARNPATARKSAGVDRLYLIGRAALSTMVSDRHSSTGRLFSGAGRAVSFGCLLPPPFRFAGERGGVECRETRGACEAPMTCLRGTSRRLRGALRPLRSGRSPRGTPPRHFSLPPSPQAGEGQTPAGPVMSQSRREPLPAPPNGTHL